MDYQKYIEWQKRKTTNPVKRFKWLNLEWDSKINEFKVLFSDCEVLKECKNALCVCARTGQEVQALKDMGIDATGIDLVPCEPLVIEGDMHNIPFEDNSFDFVFSNSFDHSFNPQKFIKEMERVSRKYILLLIYVGDADDDYTQTVTKFPHEVTSLFNFDVIKSREKKHYHYNWEILCKSSTAEVGEELR